MQQESLGLVRFAIHKPAATAGILLGGCCLALLYNVVLMQAVRTFSSVGTAVLGNFRTVLLIFASALLLGELQMWGYASCQPLHCPTCYLHASRKPDALAPVPGLRNTSGVLTRLWAQPHMACTRRCLERLYPASYPNRCTLK